MRTIILIMALAASNARAAGEGAPQCVPTKISGDGINMVVYGCTSSHSSGGGGGRWEPPSAKPSVWQPPAHDYAVERAVMQKRSDASQAEFQSRQDAERAERAKEAADFQAKFNAQMQESTDRFMAESRQRSAEAGARARADAQLLMAVAHAMVQQTKDISTNYESRRQGVRAKADATTKSTDEAIQKTQDAMLERSKELMGALAGAQAPTVQLGSSDGTSHEQVGNDVARAAQAEAERAGAEGDAETQATAQAVATTAVDVALGFIPVVGAGKDAVEAMSGRSLLTGQRLGIAGRSFAALGAITGGIVSGGTKGIKALARLARGMGTAAENGSEARAAFDLAKEITESTKTHAKYGPLDPGPLADIRVGIGKAPVSNTFHAATYSMNELTRPTKLYRSHDGIGDGLGKFWTRVKPEGPYQATYDAALSPAFNNSARAWVEITVPAGGVLHEGKAATIAIKGGELMGHGSQVYIDGAIPKTWITGGGKF